MLLDSVAVLLTGLVQWKYMIFVALFGSTNLPPALRFLKRAHKFIKFYKLLQASEILYTSIYALTKSLG